MSATTTQTAHLIDCPACKEHVIANLTYSVKLTPAAHPDGAPIGPIDKTATATLTLTGVRIQHECPTISACAPTLVPAYVDVRPPVRPQATGGFIPPTLPAGDLLARED